MRLFLSDKWKRTSNTNDSDIWITSNRQVSISVASIIGEGDDSGVMSMLSSSFNFFLPVERSRISLTNFWNSSLKRKDCQLWVEFAFLTSGKNTSYPLDKSRVVLSPIVSVPGAVLFFLLLIKSVSHFLYYRTYKHESQELFSVMVKLH